MDDFNFFTNDDIAKALGKSQTKFNNFVEIATMLGLWPEGKKIGRTSVYPKERIYEKVPHLRDQL